MGIYSWVNRPFLLYSFPLAGRRPSQLPNKFPNQWQTLDVVVLGDIPYLLRAKYHEYSRPYLLEKFTTARNVQSPKHDREAQKFSQEPDIDCINLVFSMVKCYLGLSIFSLFELWSQHRRIERGRRSSWCASLPPSTSTGREREAVCVQLLFTSVNTQKAVDHQ